MEEWDIYVVHEVRAWIQSLDATTHARVVSAIDLLAELGPGLGRPLVDTIRGSRVTNLKELRVGTARILFVFDPWRASVLLVAGDKSGRWRQWYEESIPLAEVRYETYVKERVEQEGQPRGALIGGAPSGGSPERFDQAPRPGPAPGRVGPGQDGSGRRERKGRGR